MEFKRTLTAFAIMLIVSASSIPVLAGEVVNSPPAVPYEQASTTEETTEPILFTNEQLVQMAEEAPGHWLTRSAITLTNSRIADDGLALWIEEYAEIGGANAFELEVIRLINIERIREGLAPLAVDQSLMMAARFKSQEMVDLSYFSHTSPVYGRSYVIPQSLFGAYNFLSENLSSGPISAESAVSRWMRSPGHRVNIMISHATSIGIGRVDGRLTMMLGF